MKRYSTDLPVQGPGRLVRPVDKFLRRRVNTGRYWVLVLCILLFLCFPFRLACQHRIRLLYLPFPRADQTVNQARETRRYTDRDQNSEKPTAIAFLWWDHCDCAMQWKLWVTWQRMNLKTRRLQCRLRLRRWLHLARFLSSFYLSASRTRFPSSHHFFLHVWTQKIDKILRQKWCVILVFRSLRRASWGGEAPSQKPLSEKAWNVRLTVTCCDVLGTYPNNVPSFTIICSFILLAVVFAFFFVSFFLLFFLILLFFFSSVLLPVFLWSSSFLVLVLVLLVVFVVVFWFSFLYLSFFSCFYYYRLPLSVRLDNVQYIVTSGLPWYSFLGVASRQCWDCWNHWDLLDTVTIPILFFGCDLWTLLRPLRPLRPLDTVTTISLSRYYFLAATSGHCWDRCRPLDTIDTTTTLSLSDTIFWLRPLDTVETVETIETSGHCYQLFTLDTPNGIMRTNLVKNLLFP